jgi:hypothetical protein
MPHSKLDETLRAVGLVPQVCVSESAEDVVARLVRSGEWVDVTQLLACLFTATPNDALNFTTATSGTATSNPAVISDIEAFSNFM